VTFDLNFRHDDGSS